MAEQLPFSELVSKLAPFLATNPESKIEPSDDFPVIRTPWGDESFVLRFSAKNEETIRILNNLRLPPRFSAIWHIDSGDLEFIWGPIEEGNELMKRGFLFLFGGKEYRYEFVPSSNSLLKLAQMVRTVQPPTESQYRNLNYIRQFPPSPAGAKNKFLIASYIVRGVNCGEDQLVSLARHLNFYMHFFDRRTPLILLHEPPIDQPSTERPIQFPFKEFPPIISGNNIDSYLLSLWESSINTTDIGRRFLYSFQIVEYAAFYYLRDNISRNIRQILTSPDLFSKIEEVSHHILDTMVEEKASDESKFASIIQEKADPLQVWNEVNSKLSFFIKSTDFDGGCSIPALVGENWTVDVFKSAWIPKLPDILRKIRNGLVHSRELRQSKCILPTNHNNHLLRPWAGVMETIASQIIVYRNS